MKKRERNPKLTFTPNPLPLSLSLSFSTVMLNGEDWLKCKKNYSKSERYAELETAAVICS